MDTHSKDRFEIFNVRDGELLRAAQTLRGQIFFGDSRLDTDVFDNYCDHLVAVDHAHEKVVGTYRLLRSSQALGKCGFYSQTEFNIDNILKNCSGELLELGRACVLSSYRRYPVINLLWKEIIEYIRRFSISYIFGCASFSNDAQYVCQVTEFFKKNLYSSLEHRVSPRHSVQGSCLAQGSNCSPQDLEKSLPSLVKGYIKMGARVCGEPNLDTQCNVVDFFMLLDVKVMSESFKKKFI